MDLNWIKIQIKCNKKKIIVTRFEPLSTMVMMLLVMILPYQLVTNNIICRTKINHVLMQDLGKTTNGYFIVVPYFVSFPLLHLILKSYSFHHLIRNFRKIVKFSPWKPLVNMYKILSWLTNLFIWMCLNAPTLLLNKWWLV